MDSVTEKIAAVLMRHLGLEVASVGRHTIDAAIRHRLAATRAPDPHDYLRLLTSDPGELAELAEAVIVPETWFFRYAESFRHLKNWAALRRGEFGAGRPLRILSVPCSTGEEPYSIAATLLAAGYPPGTFRVDGVDVGRHAVEFARTGVYSRSAFREAVDEGAAAYFDRTQKAVVVAAQVRAGVRFLTGNIVEPMFLASEPAYDAVFCRNLFIYLTDEARRGVIATLERLLAPGGFVYMGHAEPLGMMNPKFRTVPPTPAFAFQRVGTEVARAAAAARSSSDAADTVLATSVPTEVGPPIPTPSRNGSSSDTRVAASLPTVSGGSTRTTGSKTGRVGSPQAPGSKPGPHPGAAEPAPTPILVSATPTLAALMKDARAAADRGAADEAVALCERVIREGGPKADAFALLGVIRTMTNQLADAERFFSHALFLDPANYDALIHMMALVRNRGDEAAAAHFRRRADAAARREGAP